MLVKTGSRVAQKLTMPGSSEACKTGWKPERLTGQESSEARMAIRLK